MTSCTPVFILVAISGVLVELGLLVASSRAMRNSGNGGVGGALSANIISFLAVCATANLIWKNVFCSDDPSRLTTGENVIAGISFLLWAGSTFLLIWRLWPKSVVQYGQDSMNSLVDGLSSVFQVNRQGNTLIATLSTGEADMHREFHVVLDQQAAIRWASCIGAVLKGDRDAAFMAGHACAYFGREEDGIRIEGFDEETADVRTVCRFTREQAEQIQELVTPLVAPRPDR